ncbi:glycosyltransferase family 2 protein [Flavobacterium sp. W22_SRS_FK3]|uniref:glycosyltransferase family 2 protein n=1 Tax=Flavobacterium sp. W22_SRS_FK3 TaxID=3240275 RepID=UPI003F8F2626
MLSILIPTYNYNVYPLFLELKQQADCLGIAYEILVQDDASLSELNIENENINTNKNCFFFVNKSNLGRGKNINSLAKKAKHNWLLILDCDTFPTQNNFIKKYITTITNTDHRVIFGGIEYEKGKPKKEKLLRWVYGNKRESLSLKTRKEKPNSRALTSNLLIQKELFIKNPFDNAITKYGYEDLYFLAVLETKGIQVCHIDNPTLHLNLETSVLFLDKTKTALENLAFIADSKIINTIDSKIITTHRLLKKIMLVKSTSYIFQKLESNIRTNLLSENPSLFLFDLYKLGYYCTLKK